MTEQTTGLLAAGFRFISAAIRERDIVYVSASMIDTNNPDLPYASFFDHDSELFGDIGDSKWNCVSLCAAEVPKKQMVALGEYGQVKVFGSDDEYEERITIDEVEFREIRTIAGVPYACGMDRHVYRRDGPNKWIPIFGDMDKQAAPDIVFGFESIHGYTHDDIYAVGWHGEIWHFNGEVWSQQSSPSNFILNKVLCAPDGYVYICGLAGLIIRGRNNNWEIVDEGAIGLDLWDLEWFNDKLWISSHSMIYTLENNIVEPVEFDDDVPSSFYHLDARDGILWTIGAEDIMQFDGEEWIRIA
jgi:hypothetical protein